MRLACAALLTLGALTLACSDGRYPLDDVLTFVDVQARGTHNSYHVEMVPPLHPSHAYTHAPLDVQLEAHGVRQLELDLHVTTDGTFEIFHLPAGADEGTTCRKLVDCLTTIERWSSAHPDHLPIVVWIEPKDEDLDWADERYQPLTGQFPRLERELLSVFPRERVLTPDDVRGDHPTLPAAIAADGWPTLGRLRGRIVFSMLDSGTHRAAYLDGAPALEGRLMFVDADTSTDTFAATFKIDDAAREATRVRALVEAGFMVTSNVDAADERDADNAAKLAASLAAGAHFVSSDFDAPTPGYDPRIPGGAPARCHPLRAPPGCTAADVEALDAE